MADNTNKDLYIYRLTFGDNITNTGAKKKLDNLLIEQGVRKEFKYDSKTYYVTFRGIQINRKIYQPTQIEAELDITQATSTDSKESTTPDFDAVSALFLQRQVKLDILQVERIIDTTRTLNYKNKWEVARNCYVYELNPQIKRDTNGAKMYVKLNIFSMDKLMTLNKYSKAYVARKLGEGILKAESIIFGRFSEKEPLVITDVGNMRHLVYKDGNDTPEFIHPYLVQYNETFYDFLVRTANRCGEFLYFEDGKLTLGLIKSNEDVKIDNYETVTAQNISADLITVSDYSRDSVKSSGELKLNQSVIDRQETHYPVDAFPANLSGNSEIASDDYFFPLFKDKFTDLARELYYDGNANDIAMSHAVPFFKTILENEKSYKEGIPASLAKALIVGEGVTAAKALLQVNSVNPAKWKTYGEPWKTKKEQYNGDKVVEFAAINEKSWTTLKYYNDVHQYEESQGRQIVCINMGTTFKHVKLGQQITIEGLTGPYVIIQIQQISEVAWNATYDKYNTEISERYAGKRSLKIYAIPACKDKGTEPDAFYPPIQPVPVIRKSGPQTAFVTANEDPKFQGRVRLAFPWQAMGGAEKAQLAEIKQKIEESKEDKKELIKKIKELEIRKLEASIKLEELKAYTNATPEERKAMMAKKTAERDAINSELIKIETELQEKRIQLSNTTDEAKKQELKTEIEKLETDKKTKQEQLNNASNCISDMEKAAQEKDQGKSDSDNSIIKTCQKACDELNQKLQEARADLMRAEASEKDLTEKRDQIADIIKEKVEDMSSPWVRVSSPFATPGGGTFFRPRIGDEVLVNFENDNVERPYVVGSLYSKNNVTPDEGLYRKAAPEMQWKDISMSMMSPNGHHITFTDPSGGGNFFGNLISPGIGLYGSLAGAGSLVPTAKDLAGGIHIGDRYGIYEIEMKSHKRAIDIKSPFGTVSINAFSGITISAPNGDVTIKGQNIKIEAGNKLTLLSGKNISDPTPSTVGSKILGVVGTVAGQLTDQFLASVVDLSLIRQVVETFVRPVDGTFLIKSKRYLRLEAGHGKTTIASNRYNANQGEESQQAFFMALIECIKFLTSHSDQLFDTWDTLWDQAMKKRDAYMEIAKEVLIDPYKPDIPALVFDYQYPEWDDYQINIQTFKEHLKHDPDPAYNAVRVLFGDLNEEEEDELEKEEQAVLEEDYLRINPAAVEYAQSLFKVKEYDKNGIDQVYDESHLELNDFNWLLGNIQDAVSSCKERLYNHNQLSADQFKEGDDFPTIKSQGKYVSNYWLKYHRRVIVLMFLDKVNQSAQNKAHKYMDLGMDLNKAIEETSKSSESGKEFYWYNVIQKMDRKGAKGWLQNDIVRTLWDNTLAKVGDKIKSNKPAADNKMWENTPDGQILFSDQDNATLNFNGEGLHKEVSANQGTMEYLKKVLLKV